MDFNEEFKNLISNFNGQFNPLQKELQNLKKASENIKLSMLSRYDEVRRKIKEDTELVLDFLNMLNIPWIRGMSGLKALRHDDEFGYFSVIKSSDLCSVTESYFEEINGKLSNVYIIFRSKITNNVIYTVECSNSLNNCNNSDKERIIAMYDSGAFHNCLLKTAKKFLDYVIEVYKNDINFNKNIIKNTSCQSEFNTKWNEYIMYILKWASEHTDESNFGNSPKSYIEWKSEVKND